MTRALLAPALLLLLAGCPDPSTTVPSPDGAPGQPPPGAPGAPGEPGQPPGPPGDAAAPPAGDAAAAPAAAPGATFTPPPGLASLIGQGASVTLSGTVKGGGANVQLDVIYLDGAGDRQTPVPLEIATVTGGSFSLKAPATYDRELWLVATDRKGDQPAPTDPVGHFGPFKLEGKDVTATIELAADGAKKLPWYQDPSKLEPLTDAGAAPAAPGAPAPQ